MKNQASKVKKERKQKKKRKERKHGERIFKKGPYLVFPGRLGLGGALRV